MENIKELIYLAEENIDPDQYEGDVDGIVREAKAEIEEVTRLIAQVFYRKDVQDVAAARKWIEEHNPNSIHNLF